MRAAGIMEDPVDDLHWHEVIAADETMEIKALPAFRPDKAGNVEKAGFAAANTAFQKAMAGGMPSKTEADAYRTLVTIACPN